MKQTKRKKILNLIEINIRLFNLILSKDKALNAATDKNNRKF